MNARRTRRGGFTLIEVLVALVLMGIVLPITMRGATVAMRAASTARHQAEAATLGDAKLTEMVAQGDWQSGNTQGDFSPDYPDYRWQLLSQQRDLDVTELMMTVTWKDRGQDRSINVSTLVYVSTGATGSGTDTGTGAGTGGAP
jgi:prepilin-type N-terminal cleavage/methylation domain-containing protein